jgi:hypothetical protein
MHEYNDQALGMAKANGNYYLSSNVFTNDFIDSCFVTCLDAAGNLRFRRNIVKHEYTQILQIIPTLDDQIAFIGFAQGCDYLDSLQKGFLIKMDANGAILFDRMVTTFDPASNSNDRLKDFLQYTDSSYFAISDSLLLHFDKYGNILSRKNTLLSGLSEIKLKPDGKLLLTYATIQWGVADAFALIDTSATIIHLYPSGVSAMSKTLVNGIHTTYVVNGGIYKLDSAMQVTANGTAAMNGNFTHITGLQLLHDTVYACGFNTSSGSSGFMAMDTSLNLLYTRINTSKGISPKAILTDNSTVALFNSCRSVPSTNAHLGFSRLTRNVTYSFTSDIGVTHVAMDTAYASSYYVSSMNGYFISGLHYRVLITVKNYGATSINSFRANAYLDQRICGYNFYSERINGVNIAPGDSLTFLSDWIHSAAPGPIPIIPTLPSIISTGNVCFFTTIPNDKNDVNIDNDQTCAAFTIAVTGLEGSENEVKLSVFPNPTDGLLTIKTDAKILSVFVTDISGRTILRSGSIENIDMRTFEAGIYLITISTDKGTVTRKIIKE